MADTKGAGIPGLPYVFKVSRAAFQVREADEREVRENEQKLKDDVDRRVAALGHEAAIARRIQEIRHEAAVDERVRQLRQQAADKRRPQDVPYPKLRGHGFDNG